MEKIFFKRTWISILLMGVVLSFASCEEEYIPDTSISEQEIVVEGYIEVGEGVKSAD